MATYANLPDLAVATADAIRAKRGTTAKIAPVNFPEEIAKIDTGGGNFYETSITLSTNESTQLYSSKYNSAVMILTIIPHDGGSLYFVGKTAGGRYYELQERERALKCISICSPKIGARIILQTGSTTCDIYTANDPEIRMAWWADSSGELDIDIEAFFFNV